MKALNLSLRPNGLIMPKVFVYKTLLSTNLRAHVLKTSRFLCADELEGYAMYHLGQYPGIQEDPSEKIKGELYEVTDEILKELDRIEGEGFLYKRVTVSLQSSHQAYVYVYLGKVDPLHKIPYERQPYHQAKEALC